MVYFVTIKSPRVLLVICLEVFYDLPFTMLQAMVSSFKYKSVLMYRETMVYMYSHRCIVVIIGGANGCIDFINPDNNGIQTTVNRLQPIYLKYESNISRADFWVLAANVVILYASTAPTSCKHSGSFYFITLSNLIF